MFEKKVCPSCNKKIKEEWDFCPYCGEEIERPKIPSFKIFDDIEKEFERIDKMFGFGPLKFSLFKTKPKIRGGGISITIHSGTGIEPKIEVKTFGEYKKIEPEIKKKLGIKPAIQEVKEKEREQEIKIPKITEEPEAEIQNLGKKQIISIRLPDVKSEDDIEVKKLEQSIEVKAFADDKAYFKLIPIPSNASVTKKFKNGVLKIEIER